MAKTTQQQGTRERGQRADTSSRMPDKNKGEGIAKKGEQLKEDMEALVDEIDAVLKKNAAEFVEHFVQRGGG